MLFWRALLSFLVLPGIVAFAAPAMLAGAPGPRFHMVPAVPFLAGVFLLLWCVRDFYVAGKGTLAPWDPPRHLVTSGLYRFTRNPMYVAVLMILMGWTAEYEMRALVIYTVAVAVSFHLRVVLGEEPWLARTFGEQWLRYKDRVPRWLV